jgi:hypothetical protein
MFNFVDLNLTTRKFMLEAIDEAEKTDNIYYSKRFTEEGKKQWLSLLKKAANEYNEHWLAFKLEEGQLLTKLEGAIKPTGGYSIKHVPQNASETLAEGQFARFYMLGLCLLAHEKNISNLIVYRAKENETHRPDSDLLIGTQISITDIESQLKDIQASFKSKLVQPNSGLCLRLP